MKGKGEGLGMGGVASGTSVRWERDDVSSVETDLGHFQIEQSQVSILMGGEVLIFSCQESRSFNSCSSGGGVNWKEHWRERKEREEEENLFNL